MQNMEEISIFLLIKIFIEKLPVNKRYYREDHRLTFHSLTYLCSI